MVFQTDRLYSPQLTITVHKVHIHISTPFAWTFHGRKKSSWVFQNSNNALPTSKDVPGVIFEHTTVLQHCKQCLITQVLLTATELTIPVQVNIALPPRHIPQIGNLSYLLEYAVKIPFHININIFFILRNAQTPTVRPRAHYIVSIS